ncbi:MAG: hypothetical protein ABIO02_04760 [Patescibacteria group bacterium]
MDWKQLKEVNFYMAKNTTESSAQTLQTTMKRKEFWVGLVTTGMFLLVVYKLVPWNSVQKLTTNKPSTVVSPISVSPVTTGVATASEAAKMGQTTVTPTATSSAHLADSSSKTAKPKVSTLADTTGGKYTVKNGDNYYTISVKVCGTGKFFESIQEENNYAPLFSGDEVIVNCTY